METTPIYLKEGNHFFREHGVFAFLGDSLIIEPAKLAENIKYINRNGIKSIKINTNYGKLDSLDFLKEIPGVEGIAILQDKLDLSPLYHLKSLRRLNADSTNTVLDFGQFPHMEVLGTAYNKYVRNISLAVNLKWLWLSNLKENNLQVLSPLQNLKTLNLNNTSVVDLQGIGSLQKLEYLNIDTARQLVSLDGLTTGNSSLEFFGIYNAKNLADYTALKNVQSLKKLFVGRTGNKEGLNFVSDLKNLEEVSIG